MDCWEDLIPDVAECVLINAPLLESGHSVSPLSFDPHHFYMMLCFQMPVQIDPPLTIPSSTYALLHTRAHTQPPPPPHTDLFQSSTVAHLLCSLCKLVSHTPRKVAPHLRAVIPSTGTVTFLMFVSPGTLCSHNHLVTISRLQWQQLVACFSPCFSPSWKPTILVATVEYILPHVLTG